MLQPRREYKQLAGGRRERDTNARAHPRKVDPGSFVHSHGRAARIAEDDLPAFHIRRDFHVVGAREKASRVAMEQVVVALPVHVDPALQAEMVLLLALLWTEVIEEGLGVLLHVIAELCNDRFLQ